MSQAEMIKLIPWLALFLLVFTFTAILHKRFKERSVWGNLIKRYKDNTECIQPLKDLMGKRF